MSWEMATRYRGAFQVHLGMYLRRNPECFGTSSDFVFGSPWISKVRSEEPRLNFQGTCESSDDSKSTYPFQFLYCIARFRTVFRTSSEYAGQPLSLESRWFQIELWTLLQTDFIWCQIIFKSRESKILSHVFSLLWRSTRSRIKNGKLSRRSVCNDMLRLQYLRGKIAKARASLQPNANACQWPNSMM